MVARPRTRRSRLARWSWWAALLAVPVVAVAGLAHRQGRIDTPTLFLALAAGFSMALGAFIAALAAFHAIWTDGRAGLGAAVRGFVLSGLVLLLPGYAAFQIVLLPRLSEVSTDLVRPPAFVVNLARGQGSANAELQRSAYPDLVPRRYPLDTRKVFDEARKIVAARGWEILDQTQPPAPGQPGKLGAVAKTIPFGLREDVAIRLEADGTGTRVDMRSASRYGAHDMGTNAERVRRFLADLDFAIAQLPE